MLKKILSQVKSPYEGIPRAVWLLSIISLINRCGGMVIAFLSLYLTQHMQYSIADAGYVMASFGVGAIIGAYAGGWLTDRIGYVKVQFWSLVSNGILLLLLMVVQELWVMCVTVSIWSFTSEIFRPANMVAIMQHSDAETRTRSFSLMRMSYNLGWTIAPTLGGLVIYTFGWHWMFWADGLTCFAAAIFLWITIKEQKREAVQPQTEAQPAHPAPSPFHDRKYMFFLLMTVLGAVVFMQVIWIVPVFFKEVYGWNEAQIGWITALNGIIVVLVEMPLVFKIERKGRTLDWVKIGLILYAVSYTMFAIFPANFGLIASVLFMIFLSFGEIFVMPFSNTWVTLRAGEQKRGKYMALYTMAYSVSNILAPMMGTQVIAHWGYNTLWYLLLVITSVSWAGMWYLSQRASLPAAVTQEPSI